MKQNLIGGQAIQLQNAVIMLGGVAIVQLSSLSFLADNVEFEMGMGASTGPVRIGKKYSPFTGNLSLHLEAYMNLQKKSETGRVSDLCPLEIQGIMYQGIVPTTVTLRMCYIKGSEITLSVDNPLADVSMDFMFVDFLLDGKTTI